MNRGILFYLVTCAVVLGSTPRHLAAQTCSQLSGTFATRQSGTTSGSSLEAGSCGGANAPEKTFLFVAPRAGTYTFDTIGSEFDTVLHIRNSNGEPIACSDDIVPGVNVQSRITLTLAEAQTITVVVDGFENQAGNFILRVNPDCPLPFRNDPRDLGNPLSVSLTGTTTCSSNSIGGAMCGVSGAGMNGGSAANDATFLYAAPSDGKYTISTEGSNFDTVLYVRLGTCSGGELACSDDIDPGNNPRSRVEVFLTQGQTIVVAVDGYADESGDFVLSVVGNPTTPTITPTATRTRTPTLTPTITQTSTITPTPSITATPPPTTTRTPTRTPTYTRTPTRTPTTTVTLSPTTTRTSTATRTASTTRTETLGPSPTPTRSPSRTVSATVTETIQTPTRTPTATPSPTQMVTGPGCCQRFLPAPVCEAPISPAGCAESGGMLIANAACVRGLCVPNEATVTATPTETSIIIDTPTATETRAPTVTPSPSPTLSPTPTTARAVVNLPVASAAPGVSFPVSGRVVRGATAARILWKVGNQLQPLVEAPAATDGSFQTETRVPHDAAAGGAQVCAVAVGVDAKGADIACAPFTVLAEQSGVLVGQVVDTDETPLTGSEVFLGNESDAPVARTTTDTNGQYAFRTLAPGTYAVHVIREGSSFETVTREVKPARPTSILHRATSVGSATVYRSGTIALLATPTYVRDPIQSYWLAHFGALPGGPELTVRFFVNVDFADAEPGPISFSFLRDGESLYSDVALAPAPVLDDDSPLIADAYFIDLNVSELAAGDLTLRVARYDIESSTDIEILQELHVDMVDLGSRWLSNRVGESTISIEAEGDHVAYNFSGKLPHPDFIFDFDQALDLSATVPPLDNQAHLDANLAETYFTDDTWRGRVTAYGAARLLGVDLLDPQIGLPFLGPVGEQLVDSEYSLDTTGTTRSEPCAVLPAASLLRPLALNPCGTGCPFTAQSRPAVASCPALTINTVAAVAPDLGLTAAVATSNAGPRKERTLLDTPLCRGFIDVEHEQALQVGVRYEPDIGSCPADCAFFQDLCIDLDRPGHSVMRCLSKTIDAEAVLLGGAHTGCETERGKRIAGTLDPDANYPKDIASDGAGHALVVWVDDSAAPGTLFSSYFDGDSWNPPQVIQSAFVDSPQVRFLGPSRAIAVWEQSHLDNLNAADASRQQLLASGEIYFSEWNGSTWSTATAITHDEVADARPSLAAFPETQTAIVAWTRANAASGQPVLGLSYSLFDGASWTTAARVAPDSIGLDYGAAAAFDSSGRAAVVFTRDLDRNSSTVTDRSLVLSTLSGRTWSAGDVLGPGYFPSLAFSTTNEPVVAFVRPTQEAGASTQATGEGTRSQLYAARRRQGNWNVTAIGTRVFAEQPVARVTADNHALIVFRQFEATTSTGPGTRISAATTDLSAPDAGWSSSTLDISNTWLPAFALDREARLAFIATTQQSATTAGVSIANAVEALAVRLESQLSLQSVTPSNSHPFPGELMDILVAVTNRGLGPLSADTLISATANGSVVGTFTVPGGLRFGAVFNATLPYRINQPGVQHVIFTANQQTIGEIVFGYPPAPANLSGFRSPASAQPELSWDTPGTGIRSYRIYRDGTNSTGTYGELIGETSELRFLDVTAATGRTQRYAVRSVDDSGVLSDIPATIAVPVSAGACTGDCNCDGAVTIEEVVTATAIVTGLRPASDCRALGASAFTLEEVLASVDGALVGCQ